MIAMSKFSKTIKLKIVHMKKRIQGRLPWKFSVSKSPMALMYEKSNASVQFSMKLSSVYAFASV